VSEQVLDLRLTLTNEDASFTAIKTLKHFGALKLLTLGVQLLLGDLNVVHAEQATGHEWLMPRGSARKKYDILRVSYMLPPPSNRCEFIH
jgi:hypothetical protein